MTTKGAVEQAKPSIDVAALIDKMDFANMKLHRSDPVCPNCGEGCVPKPRKRMWECCDYTIPYKHWEQVRLHSSVIQRVLEHAGVTTITFHDVPMTVEEAVSPTHLLPLFVGEAQELGESVQFSPLLTADALSDEALGPRTLLDLYIKINPDGCAPHESLHVVGAAVRSAIERLRSEDAEGATMDAAHVAPHIMGP